MLGSTWQFPDFQSQPSRQWVDPSITLSSIATASTTSSIYSSILVLLDWLINYQHHEWRGRRQRRFFRIDGVLLLLVFRPSGNGLDPSTRTFRAKEGHHVCHCLSGATGSCQNGWVVVNVVKQKQESRMNESLHRLLLLFLNRWWKRPTCMERHCNTLR